MTRLARGFAAAATLAACLWPLPAVGAPQDPLDRLIGRPLAGVELQVEGALDQTPALLALIDIRPGDRLSPEAWRRVADRFEQTRRFESVSVLVDERPAGLVLIFNLTPRHPIDTLVFTGDTGMSRDELDRQVREEFNGLPSGDRLGEVETEVRRILGYEGYLAATAAATVIPFHNPDRATLQVAVNAGPRTIIGSARIVGRSSLDPQRTLARLGAQPGSPYRERALTAGLADIRDELRSRQFYTAIAQLQPPAFSNDGARVDLVITIEAGPVVELVVNGQLPGRLDDLIPVRVQHSVDTDLLDDASLAIGRELRKRGYWRGSATYTSEQPDPGHKRITFTIDWGKRFRVAAVDLPAGLQVERSLLDSFEPLRVGAWFNQEGVTAALVAVKGWYQLQGYHEAVMDPQFEEVPGSNPQEGGVVIRPHITEGPRAIVTAIDFDLGDNPKVGASELRGLLNAKVGGPYVLANLVLDQQALLREYERRGFIDRVVQISPVLNDNGTEAQLTIVAREGPQVLVSEIVIVGNERIQPELIRQEITLRVGEPYSEERRFESRRRLYNLSSFRTVSITTDQRLPGESAVRVLIAVEESSQTTFDIGGGLEGGSRPRALAGGGVEDRIEFAPRAFVGIGRRNLGGRNRAISAFARVSFKRRNTPADPQEDGRSLGLVEYRATASYTERYAFHTDTDVLISLTSEQAVRTSYNFIRRVGTAEFLRVLAPRVSVTGRYSLEWTRLFDDVIPVDQQPLIDRLFPQVRLSIFSGGMVWDRRDDALSPTTGGQLNANLDVALRSLGSEVGFAKFFGQASAFKSITESKRATLAVRGQVGLARGFERSVAVLDDNGDPVLGPGGDPLEQVIADLPASQRFFAGGSTTVRGFQLDRLGVAEILNEDGLSKGGNALIVLNAEIRTRIGRLLNRELSVVGFVDAGNVFNRVTDLSLSRLRATYGFGARYDSPLGPIRIDIGFKTNRMVFLGGPERRWEFHLSIGEVF